MVSVRRAVAAAVVGLVASGGLALGVLASSRHHPRPAVARTTAGTAASSTAAPQTSRLPAKPTLPPTTAVTTTTTKPLTTTPSTAPIIVKASLAGCPVPPQPPAPPPPPPWHPSVLVPSSALPPVEAPARWTSHLDGVGGKGMWIWDWSLTDGGNAQAVVRQAVQAGLHQVWLRVADSQQGFYGANELGALVPVAHAAGVRVIAWGFPYLYDPVRDARWTSQVLAWRGAGGQQIDGFSADIEEPTEGVDLTAQRAGVYLEDVRKAAGSRLLVATVYPPLNTYWYGSYPYTTIARYVDAFAPMIYWECTDPGADAATDVARLATLRPVDIIGQAYNMAAEHGRALSPSGAEITEFMQAGRKAGAIGASFWVWQLATPGEWSALAAYRW